MRGYWEQNAAGTALTLQGGKEEEIIIKKRDWEGEIWWVQGWEWHLRGQVEIYVVGNGLKDEKCFENNIKLKRMAEEGSECGKHNKAGNWRVGVVRRERWQMERAKWGKGYREIGFKAGELWILHILHCVKKEGFVINSTRDMFWTSHRFSFFMWVEHDACVIISTGYDYVKCNFFFPTHWCWEHFGI